MKGTILVTIQFLGIALLMIVTDWIILPWWSFLILGFAGFLAFWAIYVMKIGNFNVVPYPVEKGILISIGPYKLIRHPMYTSILLSAIALLSGQFDYYKLIISLGLAINLIVKMIFEEGLLRRQYPEYASYMKKTKRVIPFVF